MNLNLLSLKKNQKENNMSFISEEERKKPLKHMCAYFVFESCVDLSSGVKATPIVLNKSDEKVGLDIVARDVASFSAWWTMNILPTLNGFSGVDTIKWEFEQ